MCHLNARGHQTADRACPEAAEVLAGPLDIALCATRDKPPYQTRHTLAAGFTIGWPGLQEKASAKSGMFTTTPLMR